VTLLNQKLQLFYGYLTLVHDAENMIRAKRWRMMFSITTNNRTPSLSSIRGEDELKISSRNREQLKW